MTTTELVQQLLAGTGIAGGLCAALLAVARWGFRSARAQGERLGRVERRQELERTRRLQVEAVLSSMGVPLPPWPGDPTLPAPRARAEHDDQADDYGPEYAPPPVPRLPDEELQRVSRHRRHTV